MKESTVGRLLIEDAVPRQFHTHIGVLNSKGIRQLFSALAEGAPEKYREVSKKLGDVANRAGYESGGYSFGLEHMRADPETQAVRDRFSERVRAILADPTLSPKMRDAELVKASVEHAGPIQDSVLKNALAAKNPLGLQVESGAKGKAENLKALIAGDTLYSDSQYKPIPYPVTHSFSEGLRPHEYFAGTFGARLALSLTKLGTASGGWLAKRLNNMAHRLLVTAHDAPTDPETVRGMPGEIDDPDNEGAVLAHPVGGYSRNTVLTRQVITDLKRQGIKEALLRSPLVGGPADGGVYGRDVGVRERGRIAPIGDYVGLAASQSISEPLTQMLISSKHSGGVAGSTKGQQGFPVIDRMFSIPSEYAGGAVHAKADGLVTAIEPAPQGGHYITAGGEKHYALPDHEIKVKAGDRVEAGDTLTDGIPNPAEFVPAKGIGEGRRMFMKAFMDTARASNFNPNRRNIELVARGYIDSVRFDREVGDHVPGDVASYTWLENNYEPREGAADLHPKEAIGRYLEKPVLHYSIGTKVRPSMLPEFEKWGVKSVHAHTEPPPFSPIMVRSQDIPANDPDFMARMLGSNLEKSLLRGVHRGAIADAGGTSYAPALAQGIGFGEQGKTKGWDPAAPPLG